MGQKKVLPNSAFKVSTKELISLIIRLQNRVAGLGVVTYRQQKIIDKQSQAMSKLAEYVDRINANSKAPFSNDVEEEIKKILE